MICVFLGGCFFDDGFILLRFDILEFNIGVGFSVFIFRVIKFFLFLVFKRLIFEKYI